jgi:hypothetical protein
VLSGDLVSGPLLVLNRVQGRNASDKDDGDDNDDDDEFWRKMDDYDLNKFNEYAHGIIPSDPNPIKVDMKMDIKQVKIYIIVLNMDKDKDVDANNKKYRRMLCIQ